MFTAWIVGNNIVVGVKVEDFCGTISQYLYFGSSDIQKYPDPLNITCIRPSCASSCINTSNRQVIIRSYKNFQPSSSGADCSMFIADKMYRELGRVITDAQGIAILQYTVTEQDRLDYLDAISTGGSYDIAICSEDPQFSGNAIRFSGITIQQNLCQNVTCQDACTGQDLWGMKCDPSTGTCIQDILKQPGSPICTASHYIEYDLSFLPISFLDLVGPNIVDLSNFLGTHLPIPANIQWRGATYTGGKFRIYVIYTQPSPVQTAALLEMALSTFAAVTGGLIVFAIAQRLTIVAGPIYSTIIGAALSIAAAVSLGYIIHEFTSGTTTSGTTPQVAPVDKSKIVDDYIKNYVIPLCDQSYPGCVTVPPTCDAQTYRVYAACRQQISQCQYDSALKGDAVTTCDPRLQEFEAIDTGIADGTVTPAEAQQRTQANNETINNYHNTTVQAMTCPSGETYDSKTQKCVKNTDCWITGVTPGSCILSASTGKTIATAAVILVVGYLIYSAAKK